MAGIAGVVYWDLRSGQRGLVEGMLALIHHRGPDGLYSEARKNIALGHAKLVLHERERSVTQPVWLPNGSCGLVADARLFNRDELVQALGFVSWFRDTPSDAELLLASYERWASRRSSNFVATLRSPSGMNGKAGCLPHVTLSGVKPFFFHTDAHGIRFSSEPKQLLCLPEVMVEPNDEVIADYLVRGKHWAREETFFLGVKRLRAGHMLIAANNYVHQKRFWPASAPAEDFRGSPDECAEQFYVLFRDGVQRRLETDALVAMELSGGYDSSAIVVAAAEILNSRSLVCITTYHDFPNLSGVSL